MARTKPEVAGKIAKAKKHPAVTRPKKLEKRVAKLEKEKEEEKGHQALDGKGEETDRLVCHVVEEVRPSLV